MQAVNYRPRKEVAVEIQRPDGVIVSGNRIADQFGVAIAVHHRDDGDTQFARLQDGDILFVGIDHHENIGNAAHILDAAQRAVQFVAPAGELKHFFLGQAEIFIGQLFLENDQGFDRSGNRLPVRHHAAEPAVIDIILAAPARRFGDRLRGLALGADEQDAPAAGGDVAQRRQRLIKHRHRLLQIEDMDAVAHAKDIGTHFRVPAPRLMSEMNARFQ